MIVHAGADDVDLRVEVVTLGARDAVAVEISVEIFDLGRDLRREH